MVLLLNNNDLAATIYVVKLKLQNKTTTTQPVVIADLLA